MNALAPVRQRLMRALLPPGTARDSPPGRCRPRRPSLSSSPPLLHRQLVGAGSPTLLVLVTACDNGLALSASTQKSQTRGNARLAQNRNATSQVRPNSLSLCVVLARGRSLRCLDARCSAVASELTAVLSFQLLLDRCASSPLSPTRYAPSGRTTYALRLTCHSSSSLDVLLCLSRHCDAFPTSTRKRNAPAACPTSPRTASRAASASLASLSPAHPPAIATRPRRILEATRRRSVLKLAIPRLGRGEAWRSHAICLRVDRGTPCAAS